MIVRPRRNLLGNGCLWLGLNLMFCGFFVGGGWFGYRSWRLTQNGGSVAGTGVGSRQSARFAGQAANMRLGHRSKGVGAKRLRLMCAREAMRLDSVVRLLTSDELLCSHTPIRAIRAQRFVAEVFSPVDRLQDRAYNRASQSRTF